ncbi:hypothetical protein FRX31_033858 [Thalictrum thalictroides]|nr:hypothetical protein FRX31_033858 [Thalictrum thalictroides]
MKVLQKALEESLEAGDFESAVMSLINRFQFIFPAIDSSTNVDDDQNWLFEEEAKKRSKLVSDDVAPSGYGNDSTWPPRAYYLPEADIYALPYTVPF